MPERRQAHGLNKALENIGFFFFIVVWEYFRIAVLTKPLTNVSLSR